MTTVKINKKNHVQLLFLYIELVKNDVISNLKRHGQLNLTYDENTALFELLHNDKIIIRPADKGSGIVVLNADTYVQSLENEMLSSNSYTETEKDTTVGVP